MFLAAISVSELLFASGSAQKHNCALIASRPSGSLLSLAVSQYEVRKVRTCVLGSSDFGSLTECLFLYLITSVSSPISKYDIKHHSFFFAFM